MRFKGDGAGPATDVGNGLALKIVILRVRIAHSGPNAQACLGAD